MRFPEELLPTRVVSWCCGKRCRSPVEQAQSGTVTQARRAGETVRVSVVELELVRRLLFAAGNLAICVLESDTALVSDEMLEKARHLQALYGEFAG